MSDDDNTGCAVVLVSVLLLCFILFWARTSWCEDTVMDIRSEAVKRGHAEWITNPKGESTWQWKDSSP